ncbi:hypothetical protein CERSUDRAFT_94852 [Gelatoporia subvermispora B]|uniref:Uncharacterized protein n=1 Tax=Ceriporiopsis subvermispora (strain B) TaxID=914234 RepID=M2R025_CERS8|nr:hypothetical protein CERSUDRAFT_94852 [Gelatoporia subvermispora B]
MDYLNVPLSPTFRPSFPLQPQLVWCIALLVSCLPTRILATPFNITVDDTNGDPLTLTNVSYTPPASWYTNQDCASGDPGAPGECPPGLQANQAYDLTYHGSAFFAGRSTGLNATFTFQGTAVYVYCILNAGVFTSNMTFHLDGQQVGAYTYNSVVTDDTGIPPYQYSVPVFQFGSLSNDNHTFTLTNGDVTTEPGPYSIVLLDYFQYTTELTEEQTHSSPNPTPTNTPSLVTHGITRKSRDVIIAVAVVAAILLITMFILVFSFMRRLHADGGEVPAKNFDSSSFGENRLMSEGVASNVSGEGFVHPFISPSRQMFSPEHATSVDGALQTSTNLDSQPITSPHRINELARFLSHLQESPFLTARPQPPAISVW